MSKQEKTQNIPEELVEAVKPNFDYKLDSLFDESLADSFDTSHFEFMVDAKKYIKNFDALNGYIESEVRKLASDRKGLLKALLTNQHNTACIPGALLMGKIQEMGISHVWLKLTNHCVANELAPERDPHGALLAKAARGKVLVCKVGNAGGNLSDKATPEQTEAYKGSARRSLFAGRKAYICAVVTDKPTKYTFRQALLIMAQWGFGVKENRYIRREAGSGEKDQDCWIVEECNLDDTYSTIGADTSGYFDAKSL